MALKDDLKSQVAQIFRDVWEEPSTTGVPDPEDLRLDNHAKNLATATVLYADLDGSTNMVDSYKWQFCAEVYKAYLRCAARIIATEGGVVTAYDGDRIMAVFTGDFKNTQAVRAALKINGAVQNIINTGLKAQYPTTSFVVKHTVGIDTSQLRTARIGVRGNNDLVWIGRAANYAAKLTTLSSDTPLWITGAVYAAMNAEVKFHNGIDMWTKRLWTPMKKMEIYTSNYIWNLA